VIRLLRTSALAFCFGLFPVTYGCKSGSKSGAAELKPSQAAQAEEILQQKPVEYPTAPLTAGATVFDFAALAHTGQALKLSDFLHRPSLVYFCAQDRAPACTALATSLRDNWTDLHAHIDMVLGVSPEPSVVHDDFASEHRLPFLLLSDSDNTLHRVFGLQPGAVASYLIGKDRKILQVFTAPNVKTHAAEVDAALTALNLKQEPYPL
jgi:thioredoxin-dependent peroxiredoxin